MANQIITIIRRHWRDRHHENPQVRRTANHMILTHVELLRQLRADETK